MKPTNRLTSSRLGKGRVTKMKPFTLNELRTVLADEIHRLRNNETSAAGVNAISNATGKILSTYKLELEIAKLMGKQPSNIAGLLDSPEAPSVSPTQ